MDLNEFEERFIEAHLPIESTIRILCKPCHRKYDNSKKIHEIVPGEIDVENAVHLENYEVKEGEIIKNLINQKAMNKSKALKLSYSKGLTGFTNTNTIFSNIISIQQGWWLQPHNDKFKNLLHIILNDDKASKLYIFRMPANTIANPASHFKQRNDSYRTNCSDIYLPTSGTRFKEKNGFDFTKFLVDTITY